MDAPEQQAQNLAQQAALYGAPLGDSIRHVAAGLGLSQAAVARAMGVSAPMLSQLVSGQRIKLGNPQALQRLQALVELTQEVADGLAHDQVGPRVTAISTADTPTLTRPRRSPPVDVPMEVSRLLRAVASGRDLAAAADRLAATQPELAEVLRVYGTGPPEEAAAHYRGLAHLL
jgi:transcriptional regulator with XRE-family HTH domain